MKGGGIKGKQVELHQEKDATAIFFYVKTKTYDYVPQCMNNHKSCMMRIV